MGFNHNQKMKSTQISLPAPFQKRFCVRIDDVFSQKECQDMIEKTEQLGYEKAQINVGDGKQMIMEDYRNSDRCMIDDEVLAGELFKRIECFIPKLFKDKVVFGLNERLRFLRYDPGQFFKPHFDGCYITPNKKKRSLITLMLYLNDGFQGGETTFLSYNAQDKEVAFVPKCGSILLFDHGVYHQGSDVYKGRKYAMRTDVMYDK
jgi:predicted 2-oxoglutarate/Fe(II)-dependent dioxygenase YbiX